ncbi:MAG: MoxR family ATPase [Aquificota bacterium]|nr:MoxR family ATPase [Aquificota bacterium]
MDFSAVIDEVSKVLKGKEEVITYALTCLLAEGHLLIEDVPGVGKTTLALSLARALDLSFARIQFTSDLLPSDITGSSIFDQARKEFVFKEGPVFHNVVLADEINRATPKTQSALLEAMAERQVTVDGVTYKLPEPFFVMATQNPLEYHGTYPLPESQMDRFMMRLSLGYPDPSVEKRIITGENPLEKVRDIRSVMSREEILRAIGEVRRVYVSPEVADFIMSIVLETRNHPAVILGLSTRGAIHLTRASRSLAYLRGRDFVVPEDVIDVSQLVIPHRIIVREEAGGEEIVKEILKKVKVP